MTLSNRIGATLLGLLLILTLACCGSGQEDASTSDQAPASTEEQAGNEAEEPTPADAEAHELGPYTYQMLTYNGEDTTDAKEEYLNSGYDAAAFQLTLYDDGGGLLYTGRTIRGVRYRRNRLTIDGVRTTWSLDSDRLVVELNGETMIFEPTGTASGSRTAASSFVGRYNQLDNLGTVLDRLRLRDGGVGAHLRAGATKKTKVFWGTDPVFGMDYLMIRGVFYEFYYEPIDDSDPTHYIITVQNEQRSRYTWAKD